MDYYHSTSFARFQQSSGPPPYPRAADRSDALLSSSSSNPSLHTRHLFDPSFAFSALPQPQRHDPLYAADAAAATLPGGAATLSSLSSYPAHHAGVSPSCAAYLGNQQYGVDPATYGGVVSVVFFDFFIFYFYFLLLWFSGVFGAIDVD